MVALTPRRLAQTVYKSKFSRNQGASYGYDIMATEQNVERIAGDGMSTYGGGLTSFGGMASDLMSLDGGGLYPFGTGLFTLGTGLYPFGMGIFSKIKGLAKKAASSVLKGSTVKQLKNSVLDMGKKKARELLPMVVNKVKTEINKQAPELVTRLTSPVLNKLPESVRGQVGSMLQVGMDKGLATLNQGINKAQKEALSRISGSGVIIPSSSDPINYSDRQLGFMRNFGVQSQRSQEAGEIPKRLVLDQHSRSLADTILADRTYNKIKRDELYGQVEAAGGALMYHSQDWQPQYALEAPKPTRAARAKVLGTPAKAKGRPKGSTTKGKGIVYL